MHSLRKYWYLLLLSLVVLSFQCSSQLAAPPLIETAQPVIGTASTVAAQWQSIVAPGGCTGTIIGPHEILTASHCSGRNLVSNAFTSGTVALYDQNGVLRQSTTAVQEIPFLYSDVAVWVTKDLLQGEPMRVYPYAIDSTWVGRKVYSIGFGGTSNNKPAGAWMTIQSINATRYNAGGGGDNATDCPGDSGGPDLAFLEGAWYIVGIHNSMSGCGQNPPFASYDASRSDVFAAWLRAVVPQRDDVSYRGRVNGPVAQSGYVNSDTKADFIVTTSAGTQLYLSTGTAFTQVAIQSQIPNQPVNLPIGCYAGNCQSPSTLTTIGALGLGQVEAALGDFNGDGHDDLFAMTQKGYGIWLATSPNYTTFDVAPYFFNDGFQVGYSSFAIASFDGTNQKQILFNNVNGSAILKFPSANTVSKLWELLGTPRVYDSRATVVGPVTAGSSHGTGVLFQTPENASLWIADSNGSLTIACSWSGVYASSKAVFYPGHFFSDTSDNNVLAVRFDGTFLVGWDVSGCNPTAIWTRTDLPLNQTAYYVADFTGDGLSDLIISNTSGSYEYVATGSDTTPFSTGWTRTDLTLTNTPSGGASTDFFVGDWSGDGRDDLWITTGSGSYGYAGLAGSGGFQGNVWTRSDLTYRMFENH